MNDRHPTKRVQLPNGTRPGIDIMLVPLIKALWKAGYQTIGSCQDHGESLRDYGRKAAYWKGYALLEMPVEDARRLLDAVKDTPQFFDRMHWADPGAWTVSVPVLAFGGWRDGGGAEVSPWAQIHFPNDQLDDLIKVITAG